MSEMVCPDTVAQVQQAMRNVQDTFWALEVADRLTGVATAAFGAAPDTGARWGDGTPVTDQDRQRALANYERVRQAHRRGVRNSADTGEGPFASMLFQPDQVRAARRDLLAAIDCAGAVTARGGSGEQTLACERP